MEFDPGRYCSIERIAKLIVEKEPIVDYKEYLVVYKKLLSYAKSHPKEFRDARAAMIHHDVHIGDEKSDVYNNLINFLRIWESKYGNRSLAFRTLIQNVSVVELNADQVKKGYERSKECPPAYDPLKRHENSDPELNLPIGRKFRREIGLWVKREVDKVIRDPKGIRKDVDPCIRAMAQMFHPEGGCLRKLRDKPEIYGTLRNGSHTMHQVDGCTLLDIEAQCFIQENDDIDPIIPLLKYYRIQNYTDTDICHYLRTQALNRGRCNAQHTVVPDKDGKRREVYNTNSQRAVIGKAVMDRLEKYAREVPGFYTYNQHRIIDIILQRNSNKEHIILTIDMEKFSDTIVRKYLFDIIEDLGLPHDVRTAWEYLLDVDVWDLIKKIRLGHNDVVLQGQYTVFLLMSCLNLCIQRYINHRYNKDYDYRNSGVLGDDTIMVFYEGKPENIFHEIENMYGSYGMKINRLKSDILNKGIGQGQFAKVDFDRIGIIDSLNPKNIENHNLDGTILDILDLHTPDDQKFSMLSQFCMSETIATEIMNYHVINGGLYNGPVRKEDINIYKNNISRINEILRNTGEVSEERNLEKIAMMYHDEGYGLIDSPLFYILSEDQIKYLEETTRDLSDKETESMCNELIIVSILNMDKYGNDIDFNLLDELEGKIISDLELSYEECLLHPSYVRGKDFYLYQNLIKFDQFMAKRKMGKKGKYSSVFKPCFDGSLSILKQNTVPANIMRLITDIRSREEYRDQVVTESRNRILRALTILGYSYRYRYYGTKACFWITPPDKIDGKLSTYSIHTTYSPYYDAIHSDAKYSMLGELLVKDLMVERLNKLGIRGSYEGFKEVLLRF